MNITTKFLNTLYFARRQKAIARYSTQARQMQERVMARLVNRAQHTEWGIKHKFSNIHSYDDFAKSMSLNTYEELKSYIHRMREGESDVLWPGKVRWYAKSSGT